MLGSSITWLIVFFLLIILTVEFYIIKCVRIADCTENAALCERKQRKATDRMILCVLILAVAALLLLVFHGPIDELIDEWFRPKPFRNEWDLLSILPVVPFFVS